MSLCALALPGKEKEDDMTREKFFQTLRKAREAGFIPFFYDKSRVVRLARHGKVYSSINAVYALKTADFCCELAYDIAASSLGMSYTEADLIAQAEDDHMPQSQAQEILEVRYSLLAALELQE